MLVLIHRSVRDQLEAKLTTVSQVEGEALSVWFAWQRATAEAIAGDPAIRDSVLKLVQLDDEGKASTTTLLTANELTLLRADLQPLLKAHGYEGFAVLSPDRRILASQEPVLVGDSTLAQDVSELEQVLNAPSRTAMVLPFASVVPLPDLDGKSRAGVPTMFSLAPVFNDQGEVVAAIGFRIRPEKDFTRILAIAQPGNSGETYAFDRQGRMLSQSRFDAELREMGLISQDDHARSLLRVSLRDPGVDLTLGGRSNLPRNDQPLTYMAAHATQGTDGVNLDGYRDYRGVRVIGAWQWFDDYDFGIATEIDYDEAYSPLRYLNCLFAILFSVLTVASAISLRGAFAVVRLRREVREACQVGQYQLENLIGEGGMGQVYLAHHALLKRPTAIKLLRPGQSTTQALARFEREVQLASQLTHPNTVEIFDFGRTPDDSFYCAMEYLPGITLDVVIRNNQPVPIARVISILRQICRSLGEAHEKGMVHRDIKPQNIMLCERGGEYDFVKVLDFGLAKRFDASPETKLTAEFQISGTPLYIAPETIGDPDNIDGRADLYAVGVIAFELLTGVPPFTARSIGDLIGATLGKDPPRCSAVSSQEIPHTLDDLVLKCLAKDPCDRWPSAASIDSILQRLAIEWPWTAADGKSSWLANMELAEARPGNG